MKSELIPGNRVVYIDVDRIQWGPWKVIGVVCDEITVLIDDVIEQSFPRNLVQKVDKKGVDSKSQRFD